MTLDHFEGDGTADNDFSVPSVQCTEEEGGLGRSSPRRRRSQAEKRALVEMAMQPGTSVSEVAECFGIKASQIYGWRRQLLAGALSEPDTRLYLDVNGGRIPGQRGGVKAGQ